MQKYKDYSHLPRFTSIPAPISASARGRHNNQPSPSAKNIKNLMNCRPQACNSSNFLYFFWKNPISFCLLANDVAVFENLYKQKNPFLEKKIVLLRFRFRLLMPKNVFFPQKCSVSNETLDSSFFFDGRFNRAVVFSIFTLVCLLSFPLWFGLFQIVLFVRLLSWTHIWHISLKSLCIRPIWHRIQETWKKNTYFPALACANFKFSPLCLFVC